MTKQRALILILMTVFYSLLAMQPDFPSDPAISPDGTTVCFEYDDDLWLVSFSGGDARRLTATEAGEWGPAGLGWQMDRLQFQPRRRHLSISIVRQTVLRALSSRNLFQYVIGSLIVPICSAPNTALPMAILFSRCPWMAAAPVLSRRLETALPACLQTTRALCSTAGETPTGNHTRAAWRVICGDWISRAKNTPD